MQWILVRHGESISNAKKQLQGQYDSPLSDKGIFQAQELNHTLKRYNYHFTKVYSSDLQRAAHTAKIITQDLDVPRIVFSPLLRELDLGILTKRFDHSLSSVERSHLATLWVDNNSKIDGGESINQLLKRLQVILQRISAVAGIGEKILIIAHGGVIYNILCRIWSFKINLDEWMKNCQINEVLHDHRKGSMKLTFLNGEQLPVPQEILYSEIVL
jgi:probable phosphoglycerate mutase